MISSFAKTHLYYQLTTSDADLSTRIGIAYTSRPRIAWHQIQVAVRDAIVTLRGVVPTSYDKQLIIAITRHVAGVRLIEDKLSVAEKFPPEASVESDADAERVQRSDSNETTVDANRQIFNRLPVVSNSLEDILASSVATPGAH